MKSQPTVSVCIPTFKRGQVLEQAIESVLQQSFVDFELVVSDNASPYDIHARLAKFGDPRIRILRQDENIGMVRNFNACIAASRGHIIKPLCDDDVLHPSALSQSVNLMHDVDLLILRDMQWHGQKPVVWPADSPLDFVRLTRGLSHDAFRVDCVSPSNVAFTRNLWDRVGPYREAITYSFDFDFLLRARATCDAIRTRTPLCAFRRWAESETMRATNPFRNFPEFLLTLQELLALHPDKRQMIMYAARHSVISQAPVAVKCALKGEFSHVRQFITTAFHALRLS